MTKTVREEKRMNIFREFILNKLETLHIKLNYGHSYNLNSTSGLKERIEDLAKYEQLKEIVRENPEWDDIEFAQELSERIRVKTTLR